MKKTILVADSNLDDRVIYCEYLEHLGYRVVVAKDGSEAVEAALRERPDLILMHLSMPNVSGEEALRTLRNRPDMAEIPVIAMTAYPIGQRFTPDALQIFDEVLWKPIEPKEVAKTVSRHIGDPPRVQGTDQERQL